MKLLFFAFLTLISMQSCVQHKPVRTGFGGGFGPTGSDAKVTTNTMGSPLSLQPSSRDFPSGLVAEIHKETEVTQSKQHSVLPVKNSSALAAGHQIEAKKKLPYRTKYKPAGDGGGAAVLVLLIFVGLILWGLVKLAGISLGQILLILGIVFAIVLVFTIFFAFFWNQ